MLQTKLLRSSVLRPYVGRSFQQRRHNHHRVSLVINGNDIYGGEFQVKSPLTSTTIWNATAASRQNVEDAVSSAQAAFLAWSATKPNERRDIFLRAADIMEKRKTESAAYMHQEIGAGEDMQNFILGLSIEGLRDTAGRIAGAVIKSFNVISSLAVSMTLMATWEALCSTMGSGLISGGPVALVYGFITAYIGNICTALTLGELASMYPHAGGQYHVFSEIAPSRFKLILTWYCTYFTSLGWLAVSATAPFLASQMIQGLLILNYPDFVPHSWLSSCIYWGILAIGYVANVWGYRILPALEKMVMALHIVFFVIVFVVALVMPPERKSASFVSTTFINETGWQNNGIAWMLGLLTSAYVMTGYDAAMDLSEKMQNPKMEVPRAMVGAIGFNGILGFAVLLAVLFGIGDQNAALASPTGYPIIQIFYWMTRNNKAAATALTSTIVFSAATATLGMIASSSRTVWSTARDGVLPGSKLLSRLSPKYNDLPFLAITFTTVFMAFIELPNIASTTAFNAILSLAVVGLYLSYIMPVLAILCRRLRSYDAIQWGPWRLHPLLGLIANVISLCYLTAAIAFFLLPPFRPVTKDNMNYAGVIVGGVLIISTVTWIAYGRKHYKGPVST